MIWSDSKLIWFKTDLIWNWFDSNWFELIWSDLKLNWFETESNWTELNQTELNWIKLYPSTTTRRRDIQRNINNSAFNIYVTAPFTVSLNISASSGRRRIILPPFDAAWRGDSNELCRILLWSLDAEIFNETVKGAVT